MDTYQRSNHFLCLIGGSLSSSFVIYLWNYYYTFLTMIGVPGWYGNMLLERWGHICPNGTKTDCSIRRTQIIPYATPSNGATTNLKDFSRSCSPIGCRVCCPTCDFPVKIAFSALTLDQLANRLQKWAHLLMTGYLVFPCRVHEAYDWATFIANSTRIGAVSAQ